MKTTFPLQYTGMLSLFEKPAINGMVIKRYIRQLQYINDNIKHILGGFLIRKLDKYYQKIISCQNLSIEEVYTNLSESFQELEEYNDLLLSIEIFSGISILEELRNRNERMKNNYYGELIINIEMQILNEVYHWMISGKITDNLFIVEQNHSNLQFHESYWKDKYKIKKDAPYFLKHLTEEIYLSGVYVNFMKLIVFSNIYISYSSTIKYKNYTENVGNKSKIVDNINDKTRKNDSDGNPTTESQEKGHIENSVKFKDNYNEKDFENNNIIHNISELIYNNAKKEIKDTNDIVFVYKSIGKTCEMYINQIIKNELNIAYKLYFNFDSSHTSDMFDLLGDYIYLPIDDSLFRINSNISYINNHGYVFEYSEVRMNHLMLKILNISEFTGNIRKNVIENLTLKPKINNIINLFLSKKDFLELEIIFRYVFTLSAMHKILINQPKKRFILNSIHLIEHLKASAYSVMICWKKDDQNKSNLIGEFTNFIKSCLNKMFLTSNNIFKIQSNIIDLLFEYIYEKDNEERYNTKLIEMIKILYNELRTVSKDPVLLNFLMKFSTLENTT